MGAFLRDQQYLPKIHRQCSNISMNGYIAILIIIIFIAIVTIYVKFGTIAGIIFSAVAGAGIAHEILGRSWTLMGALVFTLVSYYLFAPSLTSQLIEKLKNKDKK